MTEEEAHELLLAEIEAMDVRLSKMHSDRERRDHLSVLQHYGCEIWIGHIIRRVDPELSDAECALMYDAAAELCRRGILRAGPRAPRGVAQAVNTALETEGYSLTNAGRKWIRGFFC